MHKTNYIFVDTWERQVAPLSPRIVFKKTDEVRDFFLEVANTGESVVLVTACNDSGLHVQADAHPNQDIIKLAESVSWPSLMANREKYTATQVGPACRIEKCHPADRYSAKTDRYTWCTFNRMPDEVRWWFTTNLNCVLPRTELIPFGINHDGQEADEIEKRTGREKRGLLYVNFQDYTQRRIQLKREYASRTWATFRPKSNVPAAQFLDEVADHKFILAPPGNGLDCYRTWESIYLGSIPILEDSAFARTLMSWELPLIVVNNLSLLTQEWLEDMWAQIEGKRSLFNLERATLAYWQKRILSKCEG